MKHFNTEAIVISLLIMNYSHFNIYIFIQKKKTVRMYPLPESLSFFFIYLYIHGWEAKLSGLENNNFKLLKLFIECLNQHENFQK